MGNDSTVSGTFLRASDGQFVSQDFKVRPDLVFLPAEGMVVNKFMARADYDDALKCYANLTDPLARKTYGSLASWFTYDRKGYEERVAALPEATLNAFEKAGVKLSHTHLYAIDDKVNHASRAGKDRMVDIGIVKLPESRLNFVNLSMHMGGLNMFEASRMREVFKNAGQEGVEGTELAAHTVAKRLQNVSKLKMPEAITAARSFLANPKLVR